MTWPSPSIGTVRCDAISRETRALNEAMVKVLTGTSDWSVAGAAATRAARRRGEGPFPAPVMSTRARTRQISGKDGNEIPLHIIAPDNPRASICTSMAAAGCSAAPTCRTRCWSASPTTPAWRWSAWSTGWRRNTPIRRGPTIAKLAAVWLTRHVKAEFGTDVLTIGGESAGGHLSVVTLLRMRDRHGYTGFRGANLVYGAYDLSMTPSQRAFGNERLVLRTIDIVQFANAFLPATPDRRVPDISPLYANLHDLPPALLSVGTSDALLDDTLFMQARWAAAGNEAELEIYPGAAHGFTLFPNTQAKDAETAMAAFLRRVTA